MSGPGAKWKRALAIAVLVCLAAVVSFPSWAPGIGTWLVESQEPRRADAILVLAGDGTGRRMLAGAELGRRGVAPKVYVSGPDDMYERSEAEYEIEYAVRKGYPAGLFVPLPMEARSTLEEARAALPALRAAGVRRLILVTSDTHTRRAGATFRRLAPEMEIRTYAVRFPGFDPGHWWRDRESRKIIFYEWSKTLAGWMGM